MASVEGKKMRRTLEEFFFDWPEMVSMVDAEGNFAYANKAFEAELGWKPEELVGKHYSCLLLPEDIARAQTSASEVWSGTAAVSYETRSVHKDGQPLWTHTTARFSSTLGFILVFTRNVDAQIKQKDALRQGRSFFQQVIDAVEECILVKGKKSKLLWANKAFREFYGMTNEQLLGLLDAPFNEPDYTQQYVKDDLYVFETGKPLHIPSEPVTRHDGVVRNFYTVKSPIFEDEGKVSMTVGISRDITDVQAAHAKAVESAKMVTLGEMAAGIAHEINNPLAVITGRIAAMRDRVLRGKVEPETWIGECEKIEKTAMRIARIVKGLRAFSRSAENDPFVLEKVETIVEDAVSLCHERLNRNGIDLRLKIERELKIECRPSQLAQVVINLVANSIDAIENAKEKWIQLEVYDSAAMVEWRVTDSGCGIPVEIRRKIMLPFFTTKQYGRGTGLGLSISKGIAEEHLGTLFLNEQSKNTQFCVQIPQRRYPKT